MFCSKCGKQNNDGDMFCSGCGVGLANDNQSPPPQQPYIYQQPIQPQILPKKPKKPLYKRVWFWLIVVFIGIPMLSGIINGGSKTVETNTPTLASSSMQESSKATSNENDMDEGLLKVIQYHKDKINGTESDSALNGSEMAFNLNLGLYKPSNDEDNFRYRTYYYALKGEQEYINEFDDDRLVEVRDYIKALDTENIMEKAFEKYAIEAEEKEREFQESIIKISAIELAKAYEENEVKANSLYKGKTLEVSGVVSSIGAGMFDSVYITLSDGKAYSLSESQFSFQDNAEKEKVAELSKGDTVTIIGKCTGETLGKPMVSECKIID